jgi:hypothetical protein
MSEGDNTGWDIRGCVRALRVGVATVHMQRRASTSFSWSPASRVYTCRGARPPAFLDHRPAVSVVDEVLVVPNVDFILADRCLGFEKCWYEDNFFCTYFTTCSNYFATWYSLHYFLLFQTKKMHTARRSKKNRQQHLMNRGVQYNLII